MKNNNLRKIILIIVAMTMALGSFGLNLLSVLMAH